eukprot:jgi/Bigna1/59898/fgenesh1_kg.7_\
MKTRDVLALFRGFNPTKVEWLDDDLCNICFPSREMAVGAFQALTERASEEDLNRTKRRISVRYAKAESIPYSEDDYPLLAWQRMIIRPLPSSGAGKERKNEVEEDGEVDYV